MHREFMMQIGYELHPQFEQAWASAQNENLRLNQGKEGLCHRLSDVTAIPLRALEGKIKESAPPADVNLDNSVECRDYAKCFIVTPFPRTKS